MIPPTETWKTCKHCEHVIQSAIRDGYVTWVHAGTGKMSCAGMFAEPKTS